jgi:hypothetical protein
MLGTIKFCTHMLHMEGEEVFGSQKRKPNILLGDKHESHRLDRVNFTCPRVKIRSSQARIVGCYLTNI